MVGKKGKKKKNSIYNGIIGEEENEKKLYFESCEKKN